MKHKFLFGFFLLIILSLFWLRGVWFLDPDFGWHFRAGEMYWQQGIPSKDPFSYTMPNYPWVNHEWLADVILIKLYSLAGNVGLAGVDAILAVGVLLVGLLPLRLDKKDPLWLGWLVTLSLAGATLFYYARSRYAVITWLLLIFLLRFILIKRDFRKRLILLPLLFWLWANLHGGFAAGLAAWFLLIVVRSVNNNKLEKEDILLFAISLASTLVNPYGLGLWREIWSSLTDFGLKLSVQEWMPVIFSRNLAFPFYLAWSLVLVARFRKKFALEELWLFGFFLVQGLISQRQVPLWIAVSLPMVLLAQKFLFKEVQGRKTANSRFNKAQAIFLIFSLLVLVLQLRSVLKNAYAMRENGFYPKKAVVFLRQNPTEGEIFSDYGWGGYLIWKLPDKKVFLDGRMPSWRWKAPVGESDSAFMESQDLLSGEKDFKKVFTKYRVNTVLWPLPKYRKANFIDGLRMSLERRIEEKGKNNNVEFINELEKAGWEQIFKNETAVIYRKPG